MGLSLKENLFKIFRFSFSMKEFFKLDREGIGRLERDLREVGFQDDGSNHTMVMGGVKFIVSINEGTYEVSYKYEANGVSKGDMDIYDGMIKRSLSI